MMSLLNKKKQKKIEDTIESIIDDKNPFRNFDNFWWEDDLFSAKDSQKTVEASKNILDEIQEMPDNILRKIWPVDNRTVEEKIEDDFIPIDDRTRQELEDDDYNSLESDIETEEIDTITPNLTEEEIDTTTAWDPNQTEAAKPGPIIKLSTDYNKKIKAANKIKNKYLRKKIGQRNKSNKISKEWLKTADYLDTKDQGKINYIFVPPKKEETNEIPGDAGHFIQIEIESTDFKKENLESKIRKNKTRKPYISRTKTTEDMTKDAETVETIKILDNIATLEPGKNAQLAAKKISEKYKKIREANAKKNKYKMPGEIVTIETVKPPHGEVKVPVSTEKPKRSGKEAAEKIIKSTIKLGEKRHLKNFQTQMKKENKRKTLK